MLIQFQIFERSAFSNEVGAAVTISPNGTRVLRELGFDFKKGGGVRQQHLRLYNAKDLSPIVEHDYGDVETLCGAPWQAMHRRDLHGALYDLALQDDEDSQVPVKLHARAMISHVDIENAAIELEDGRRFSGDLLIGADGLRSVVRTTALGEKYPPIDTEWQIYRFLLPRETIMNDPLTKAIKKDDSRVMYEIPDATAQSKLRFVWYECREYVKTFASPRISEL
jgi:salicylate hydroxylase